MKYQQQSFSVNTPGTKQYRDNWDAIFGSKTEDVARFELASNTQDQVKQFHESFGLPVAAVPAFPPKDRIRLRLNLITEEYLELLTALGITNWDIDSIRDSADYAISRIDGRYGDLVEVADALGDLDYVIEGTRLEFGLPGAEVAAEIHRSNMEKLGPDGKPLYREDGKVVKPPHWTPPDIRSILLKYGWKEPTTLGFDEQSEG